ncbi:nicotinate-nucleotide--dimethylbenzimidazole phosphoribosyltransferase [Natronocella acetinitrilica]|uniref:Nicotinate-nucleotide--dimethylbenzimidazole phosphoribosyltransferase n=1 Tax=Natronocella acetinitrilica TaxID=414046 RepID=A0AAE3G0H3_9GAMM|nr:nicotinate-nucleotide--dimethylbenzimidazole phosphoribosyltransferase [Natronocella acetinitrilica]MCP1673261.1 nicotinate-nucleotide--dimethylbenzimidazole phosphoribosyltransferase [Natronocella acetinitrilica]
MNDHLISIPRMATLDREMGLRAEQRQRSLTKPPGSLGRLERLAVTLAMQQRRERPRVDRVQCVLFAADHGVCAEGVSAFPQAVTGQMVANFAGGGAAISVLSRHLDAALSVINVGTIEPLPALPGVQDARVGPGTGNIAREPAMTREQLARSLAAGDAAAESAADNAAELVIGGEMGIGNTTAAAALACALTGALPTDLVGRGTGVDDAGMARKRAAVRLALERHGEGREPLDALASLGGFEIAALAGLMLGCGQRGIAILVDGFIASTAALAAVRAAPDLRPWLHFAHRSAEAGHRHVLGSLEAEPLLNLEMRLGEGSGAAVAVPLLRMACALHDEMASFSDAGVDHGSP